MRKELRLLFRIFPVVALFAVTVRGEPTVAKDLSREIKTYMSYGLPVDPAKVFTLVDLDLSYALASTLVDWSDSKEVISGLADRWENTGEKEITFHLSPKAKWSDGSTITASDVVSSFDRAQRLYGKELKSLFDVVESIQPKKPTAIVFKLKVSVAGSGVIRKLTEPMYGIVATAKGNAIDFAKSSGPYSLKASSETELKFDLNKNWFKARPNMAEHVVIRQRPKGAELQASFLKDEWVNLLTTSSLVTEPLKDEYRKLKFTTWNRNLDKLFFLSPGPRLTNADGRALVRILNRKMNRATLMKELNGLTPSDQFFSPGYVLFDPEFRKSIKDESMPEKFKTKPVEILGIEARLTGTLRTNFVQAIKDVTGIEPIVKTVALADLEKARSLGQYDFVFISLPVNDANVEGALGYIFGMTPSYIPDASEAGEGNFHARISDAAKLVGPAQKNSAYRKVFADAINAGSVLPLFHFSTIVMAKDGIDLSTVPATDETVAFSKVRFK